MVLSLGRGIPDKASSSMNSGRQHHHEQARNYRCGDTLTRVAAIGLSHICYWSDERMFCARPSWERGPMRSR